LLIRIVSVLCVVDRRRGALSLLEANLPAEVLFQRLTRGKDNLN